MPSPSSRLSVSQAVALGALHGPAELLPISSSGHTALVPWLLGWEYAELDPELRKAFEVALHAGTAAALLLTLRAEVGDALRDAGPRLIALLGLSFVPPAVAGYALERGIERRLGTPATIATGLVAGGLAMAWADRTPQTRETTDAGMCDALWLGLAQTCALVPGISRNGATLAAARRRGFTRAAAARMSRHVALPVIAGATGLKGVRLWRRGVPREIRAPFAAGVAAAFGSTLASSRLMRALGRDRSLAPYTIYRVGLATLVIARLTGRPTTMAP